MDVIPHFCTGQGCEALHGGTRESDEVRIAKINRDADVEIARLQRSEARQEIEAATEQTEIIAEATVEESVAKAEVLDDILAPDPEPEPEPEPEVVPVEMPEAEPEPEPVDAPAETEPAESTTESKGWWAGYR